MKKSLLAGFVLALLSIAAVFLLRDTAEPKPVSIPPRNAAESAPKPDSLPASARSVAMPTTTSAQPILQPTPAASALPQGVRGVLHAPTGAPVVGARVFLQESAQHDLVGRYQRLTRNVGRPPTAATVTDDDGAFQLGLSEPPTTPLELWALADAYADLRVAELTIERGAWLDLGVVSFEVGRTLHGRVEIAGALLPAPKATVRLEPSDPFQDIGRRGIFGAGPVRTVTCEADGSYEFLHVPARGRWRLTALAPGFARQFRDDLDLTAPGELQVDFQLLGGKSILGRVVDPDGRPIAAAEVEAWPTAAEPSFRTATDSDGRFQLDGLRDGPHRLHTTADGFQAADLAQQISGGPEILIRLERRATASLQVRTPDGDIVREFRLAVRLWFPQNGGQIGPVAELPERLVQLEPGETSVPVHGIDPGSSKTPWQYVFQVEAQGFAKSLSTPFTVDPLRPVRIDLVLTRGGAFVGKVIDETGKPIPSAKLTTQAAGYSEDNPIWRMLASTTSDRITRTTATTDESGNYRLASLAHAAYQLRIEHPDFCRALVPNLSIASDGELPVPTIVLKRGARIQGRTLVDGVPRGQIAVTLAVPGPAAEALGKMPEDSDVAPVEAVSNNDGFFTLPRRVPPGVYEMRARILATRNAEEDVFVQMQQLQRSAIQVAVPAGRDVVEQDVVLKNN
jgi:Carboxypeptidase regulatory-like domain